MTAFHGRRLAFVGVLATVLSASAGSVVWAQQTVPGDAVATTQQTAVGDAGTEVAMLVPAPAVAQQSYATEATARPVSPVPTNRSRSTPIRSDRADIAKPAPRYVAATPSRGGCAHLGCRGVHVLGVGW